jgi:hypothetical protein
MRRDIEVENLTSVMLDDKEAVEHAERYRRNRKKVERGHHLAMVVEECQPTLRLRDVKTMLQPLQIARHRGFRNLESELQEFAVDARRPPRWVFAFQATDQLPNLFPNLGPTAALSPRPPSPEQAEPTAMPRHHSIRVHHHQGAGPSGPQTAERNPEQSVEVLYTRSRLLAFKDYQLLAQRRDLQTEAAPGNKECAAIGEYRDDKRYHCSYRTRPVLLYPFATV